MKKKYMFVLPSLSNGGAEKVASLLANQLVKKDKEVVIITHYLTDKDYYVDNKAKIICLSNLIEKEYRDKMSPIYLIKLLILLRKQIRNENPNYIIPFLVNTCIRVNFALLGTKYKSRVIQTVRNNPNVFPKNKFLRLFRNHLISSYPKTIVQNNEQKNYFKKKLHPKIFVMNNPVDDKFFDIKRNNNELINIVGVGRLEEQKNFKILIDAFGETYKHFNKVRLSIYGKGSLEKELRKQIDDLGLTKVAKLCGRSNDYNEIYGNASIFVLSSNFEGMPNSLIEAMAVGIPVISTNCPSGPSEIITDNYNGILINTNDSKGLASKIEYLINNKEKCNDLSKNAKTFVYDNYNASKICDEFILICEK